MTQAVRLTSGLICIRNWKTFDERTLDFCQGITLHHLPGHTDGLIGMQLNLPDSGTFLFISDHCHVIENWRDSIPQGWLARDHPAWVGSLATRIRSTSDLSSSSDQRNDLSSSRDRLAAASSQATTRGRSTRSRTGRMCIPRIKPRQSWLNRYRVHINSASYWTNFLPKLL